MLFNDADGCFDQIPPSLAEIALKRIGSTGSIVRTRTVTQQKMKHHIKTGSGVSKGFIRFVIEIKLSLIGGILMTLLGPIGWVGQGRGGSPIIWLTILLILIQAYKRNNEGICIVNPIDCKKIVYWIIN